MATRIYLPSSGNPPVTPSTWNFPNQINPLTFAGVTTRIGSALTTKTEATGTVSPTFRAMLRYVIGPLAAQSISGTVNLVMRAYESNTGANATMAIAVKIIKPDGSDRAVLLGYIASDSATSPYEFTTTLSSRRAYDASETRPIPLTSQSAQAGDYLVIEIGFRSATTTNRNIQLRYGDAASSDLADGEGETNDFNPWCEFSQNIAWYEQKSGSFTLSSPSKASSAAKKGAKASVTQSIAIGSMVLGLLGAFGGMSLTAPASFAATGVKYEAGEEHYGSFAISSGSPAAAIEGLKGAKEGLLLEAGTAEASAGIKSVKATASVASHAAATAIATKWTSGSAETTATASLAYQGRKQSGSEFSVSEPSPDLDAAAKKNGSAGAQVAEAATFESLGVKGARGQPGIAEPGSAQVDGQKLAAGAGLFEAGPGIQAAAVTGKSAEVSATSGVQFDAQAKKQSLIFVSVASGAPSAQAEGQKVASHGFSVAEVCSLSLGAKKQARSDTLDLRIGCSVSATGTSAEARGGSLSISEEVQAEAGGIKASGETAQFECAEAASASGRKAADSEIAASAEVGSQIFGQKRARGESCIAAGEAVSFTGAPSFEFYAGSLTLAAQAAFSAAGKASVLKDVSRRDLLAAWADEEGKFLVSRHNRPLVGRIHSVGLVAKEE